MRDIPYLVSTRKNRLMSRESVWQRQHLIETSVSDVLRDPEV